ncbi:hypothetical protein [Roseospira visakhapatnamensis]|uniref:Uncharacterized protein n=1 Tax=Roseospira visakhapatnamensis TaxID=390880 RepID=A0A7W6WBD1_9PROT|nr:hypothetical protein [Roseospira visakhapatnamensis]MBB4267708.1 hypothetical protein [Roseospira visakhapatnamensis]
MLDLNDAGPQMAPASDLIPDGTFAKVKLTLRPGGVDGPTPDDRGLLKPSQNSDVKMLDCEFTVVGGRFDRRKFWQLLTVAGGKADANGQSIGWNITKSTIRAMVESALGINPKDDGAEAKQKRTLPSLKALDGIAFYAWIMVEPASSAQYKDQNKLANVVVPGDPEYDPLTRGEEVEPRPVDAKPRTPKGGTQPQGGAWGNTAVPSAHNSAPPAWQQTGGQTSGQQAAQGGGAKPNWL